MGLYYQDEYVTLYHGDSLKDHREWLDADVLVADPPYGMAYESNFNRMKGTKKVGRPVANDDSPVTRDAALEAWGDKPALVFGRWDIQRPEGTRSRLIWDKVLWGMGDLSFPWGPGEEEIYVLGSGFAGKRSSNVIRVQGYAAPDPNRPNHPTPKPPALMERLIEKSPPGVIADPFAGSGPVLTAAKNLRRKVIGVELEEEYCEQIAKRLSQETLDIFGLDAVA
jgi:site-specific DNA-methyltransferase (adenine-specific)